MPNDRGTCGAFATNGIPFTVLSSMRALCFSEFCSIFCRVAIKSFASPTFSGESSEWNSEINETPLAARPDSQNSARQPTSSTQSGEKILLHSAGGAQECAIHEPLFHKEDYKLFLASPLSFFLFLFPSPLLDNQAHRLINIFSGSPFGFRATATATGVTQKILSGRPLLFLPDGRRL